MSTELKIGMRTENEIGMITEQEMEIRIRTK